MVLPGNQPFLRAMFTRFYATMYIVICSHSHRDSILHHRHINITSHLYIPVDSDFYVSFHPTCYINLILSSEIRGFIFCAVYIFHLITNIKHPGNSGYSKIPRLSWTHVKSKLNLSKVIFRRHDIQHVYDNYAYFFAWLNSISSYNWNNCYNHVPNYDNKWMSYIVCTISIEGDIPDPWVYFLYEEMQCQIPKMEVQGRHQDISRKS